MRQGEAAQVQVCLFLHSTEGLTLPTKEWEEVANQVIEGLNDSELISPPGSLGLEFHLEYSESIHHDISLGSVDEETGEIEWEET